MNKPGKPFYNTEPAADMFLRSMDYETEGKRLSTIATGKRTRAKELIDSAKEDETRAQDFFAEAARLRSCALELSPQKIHEVPA